MKKSSIFAIFILLAFATCRPDEVKFESDYFIFGKLYPNCSGDCAAFYKVENAIAYRDRMDTFDGANYSFIAEPMGLDLIQICQNVKSSFPTYLNANPNKKFGNPDVGQVGGLFFESRVNGVVKKWSIDLNTSTHAPEFNDYIREVETALLTLQ